MDFEKVQLEAIDKYKKNMEFLEKHSPVLYKKLVLLDEALNSSLITSKFELEYKENSYFDILDVENNSLFYGVNSFEQAEEITRNIDMDVTVNSFKTFYEYHYEDGVVDRVRDVSIFSSTVFGNAPIVDYINRNEPEERNYKQIFCYMVFGVGLGIHLPLIKKKVKAKLYLIVEPQLEVFRLSLFTTSYYELNIGNQLIFFVGYDKDTFALRFREFHDKAYLYNQYIKFFLFSKTSEMYFEQIQSMLSSQSHTMFAYDRQLYSLIQTNEYAQDDYYFMKVDQRANLKLSNDAPYLIIAGGPSFKKNIDFVKENQNRFIIVTILSLVKILSDHGIKPDIITNYDESKAYKDIVFDKLNDKNYFDDKILLLGSHVDKNFVSLLPKENVYFFNAMYSAKKKIGSITGPSIGEMTYALGLIFAPKEMYLLGLDLALDSDTGKSHFEGYEGKGQFSVDKDATLERFSLRKNVMKVKGNLRDEVETTAVFNISIKQLNVFSKLYNPDNHVKVFNFSDGAYFNNIEPKLIIDLDIDNYPKLNKESLNQEINTSLRKISSNEFSAEDIEFNQNKLDDAKKLKFEVDKILFGNKYSSSDKYLVSLEKLDAEFSNSAYVCSDLRSIVLNYFRYNLPYIFYFFNLKNLDNPKAHIKKINKNLSKQLNKIIDEYIKIIDTSVNKKK